MEESRVWGAGGEGVGHPLVAEVYASLLLGLLLKSMEMFAQGQGAPMGASGGLVEDGGDHRPHSSGWQQELFLGFKCLSTQVLFVSLFGEEFGCWL